MSGEALATLTVEARARLDAHVRDVVAWHFDPATGTPFWLERSESLDFDPRRDVRGYADLARFGHFDDGWLRGGPIRRFVPRAYAHRPVHVFETGGTTGLPKNRVSIEDHLLDYDAFSLSLDDRTFPKGKDWLMLGPTGPRRLRLAIEHLAQHRGGIAFHVDLDPRWVTRLVKQGRHHDLEEYKQHVIDQGLKILRAHASVSCLFTTPKLLEALCEKIDLHRAGITGIFCGGTEMTAQFHRFAREELVPGIDFVPTYGNTLMGLAHSKPFDPADGYAITYYPPSPRAVIELVDPSHPDRLVDYDQVGRVMLTTLTRELFLPRFLERDEAERTPPIAAYPWDGVRNLRVLRSLESSLAVGVY